MPEAGGSHVGPVSIAGTSECRLLQLVGRPLLLKLNLNKNKGYFDIQFYFIQEPFAQDE